MELKELSNSALVERLITLSGDERAVTLEILKHLNELDSRQSFRELGYSSLFDFCLRKLKYSENSACRRIAAARAIIVNPELIELFLKGEVSLCTIAAAERSISKAKFPCLVTANFLLVEKQLAISPPPP